MISESILESRSWKNCLDDNEKRNFHLVLSKLPEDARIVIFLRYWRDFEFEDIAITLGQRLSQVHQTHKLTIQLLSKVLIGNMNSSQSHKKEAVA